VCELCIPRRRALQLAASSALIGASLAAASPAAAATLAGGFGPKTGVAYQVRPPPIQPRAVWAAELAPAGQTEPEADVRFLLVHHSAAHSQHEPHDVPVILRSYYSLHTQKGWPDIAYNFLIDRYGTIWEGRIGSADGAVAGDATGGNQGFSQLVCLIGDFTNQAPTMAAQQSGLQLLAWLAARESIDPLSTTSFVSKGSNRWDPGVEVTTPTIAGHRDMSKTACPGDAFYPIVTAQFPGRIADLLVGATTVAPSTTSAPITPVPSSAVPVTATSQATSALPTTAPPTTAPPPTTASPASTAGERTLSQTVERSLPATEPAAGSAQTLALIGASGLGLAGLAWLVRRRRQAPQLPSPPPKPPAA